MASPKIFPIGPTMPDETSINILPLSLCRSIADGQEAIDSKAMRLLFRYDNEMEYYVLPNDGISASILDQMIQVSKIPKELVQRPLIDIKYIKANKTNKLNPRIVRKNTEIKAARYLIFCAIVCFIAFFVFSVISVYYTTSIIPISIGATFSLIGFTLVIISIFFNGRLKCIHFKKRNLVSVKPELPLFNDIKEIIKISNKLIQDYSLS